MKVYAGSWAHIGTPEVERVLYKSIKEAHVHMAEFFILHAGQCAVPSVGRFPSYSIVHHAVSRRGTWSLLLYDLADTAKVGPVLYKLEIKELK